MLNNNKKQETQFFGTKCGNANSIAAGYATETTNYGEIATGILNKSTKGDNPNSPEGVVGDPEATLFSVGCGTKEERKNALEVKGDGSVIISGKDGSDVNIADLAEKIKEPSVDLSGYVKSNDIYQCIKKEYDSSKRGSNSIAIDDSAISSGDYSTAVGNNAQATEEMTIALGYSAQATNYGSIVLGSNSQANAISATALGNSAQATNSYAIAIGGNSQATGYSAIALGDYAEATGDSSIVLGDEGAEATGYASIALGSNAQATGYASIALGGAAITSTVSKYALGGFDENKQDAFNIEEITYSQYGNKKYLIGLGGYDGTNITIDNEAGEKVLNPNIKSVQEIINGKADITPIVTSTDTTISLQPNKKYEITAGDTLVLTFTKPSDKTHKNEYLFSINTGSSVSNITFPIEIIWDVEPVIAANKHYEINVQYSQGKYWGTVHTWNIPN